jgi:hypothetical protein
MKFRRRNEASARADSLRSGDQFAEGVADVVVGDGAEDEEVRGIDAEAESDAGKDDDAEERGDDGARGSFAA